MKRCHQSQKKLIRERVASLKAIAKAERRKRLKELKEGK
jgi:hypothetical protein